MTNRAGRLGDRCGCTRLGGVAVWALIFANSAGCTGLLGFDDVAFRDDDGGGGNAGAGNAAGAQDDGGLGGASGASGGTGGSTGGAGGATGGAGGSTGGTGGASGGTGGSTGGTGGSTGGTGGSTGGTGGSTGGTGGGATGGSGGSTGGTGGATGGSGGSTQGLCDAGPGREIVDLLNDYRAQNGLGAVPCSPSLMLVADTHVHDLDENQPHAVANCNLHSWSDQGTWSACCYTADHAQAQCMWDKPRELTVYTGNGYENAAAGASSPSGALDMWKNSSAHNAVMLNEGIWANHPWKAVGAALYQGYAVLWFGEQTDPDG